MNTRKLFIPILVAMLASIIDARASTITTWNGNGHTYELVPVGLNWTEANAAAQTMTLNGVSGYLASITSQAEQDFVYSSLVGNGINGAWIGLTADPAYGGGGNPGIGGSGAPYWVWTSGEPTVFVDWIKAENGYGYNEPNNFNGSEAYAELVFANTDGTPGRWNDLPNDYRDPNFGTIGYIVEFNTSVPEASSIALVGVGGIACWACRRRFQG